jgi:hypothetical protein
MRSVSKEEAANCKERMFVWVNTQSRPRIGIKKYQSNFGERAFKSIQKWEVGLDREPGLELARTPRCAQYMWRADTYFPCCPKEFKNDPLDEYFQNLKIGSALAYSDHEELSPKLTIIRSVIKKETKSILVLCEDKDHKKSIIGISHHEKSKYFIHFNLGTYHSKEEAEAAFLNKMVLNDYWSDAYSNANL